MKALEMSFGEIARAELASQFVEQIRLKPTDAKLVVEHFITYYGDSESTAFVSLVIAALQARGVND